MLYSGCGIKSVLKPNCLFSPERSDRTECSKTGWKRESGLFSPIERTPSCPCGLLTVLSRVLRLQPALPNFIVMASSRKTKCKQGKIFFVLPLFFFLNLILLFIQKRRYLLGYFCFFSMGVYVYLRVHPCAHTNVCIFTVSRSVVPRRRAVQRCPGEEDRSGWDLRVQWGSVLARPGRAQPGSADLLPTLPPTRCRCRQRCPLHGNPTRDPRGTARSHLRCLHMARCAETRGGKLGGDK